MSATHTLRTALLLPLRTLTLLLAAVVTSAASDDQPLANDVISEANSNVLPLDLVVTRQHDAAAGSIYFGSDSKGIPGSQVRYKVTIRNQGLVPADSDSILLTDSIGVNLCMMVSDLGDSGSGPVAFQDSTPSSNLSFSFIGLASATDDLEFSNDNGASFTYSPTPNTAGCDAAITHIRIRPKGAFAAATETGDPRVEFTFRVIID